MSKSYCLSLDDETAAWLDNHVRGTGGTVTAIWRDHIAQLRAINTAQILAALKGAAPGAPTPAVLVDEPPANCGVSAPAAGGACAGTAAVSSFPDEAS